jgi:hypothetical protein
MKSALMAAGFPGVEEDDGILHARLWSSSVEFTATREGGGWRLALQWPVRASAAQLAAWAARHPDAPMDLHEGETRVTLWLADGQEAGLHRWAAIAEEAVATCIGWRRAQRAPGEGM